MIRKAVETEFPEELAFSGFTKGFAKVINDYCMARNEGSRVGRLGGARIFTKSLKDNSFLRTLMATDNLRGTESLRFAEMLALAVEETLENCPCHRSRPLSRISPATSWRRPLAVSDAHARQAAGARLGARQVRRS